MPFQDDITLKSVALPPPQLEGVQAPRVSSPHVLTEGERASLILLGLDPAAYVGFPMNVGALALEDKGTHFVLHTQIALAKQVFPELNKPALLGADGRQNTSVKFDRSIGLPPVLRLVIKAGALDYPIRRSIKMLVELEGQSLGDPEVMAKFKAATDPAEMARLQAAELAKEAAAQWAADAMAAAGDDVVVQIGDDVGADVIVQKGPGEGGPP